MAAKQGIGGGGGLAVNFMLISAGALLVYAGYKGSSLRNLAQGGEADQVSNASQSGGEASASGGGGEPSGGAAGGLAGSSPSSHLAPAPNTIRINKGRKANTKRIAAALKYKEQLERALAGKQITRQQAHSMFASKYPNYVAETKELGTELKEQHANG